MPKAKSRVPSKASEKVRPAPPHRGDRSRRTETIKFLTLDEIKRLFSRITDKRDRAIFLMAYRHGPS